MPNIHAMFKANPIVILSGNVLLQYVQYFGMTSFWITIIWIIFWKIISYAMLPCVLSEVISPYHSMTLNQQPQI